MRLSWNLFPWAIGAGMAVVVAVNVGMAVSAIGTFPGKAGRDGFDLSNRYNLIMDRARDQAALGWKVGVAVDGDGHPAVTLTAADGGALAHAEVRATARRPVGDPEEMSLVFVAAGDGRYVTGQALPAKGQWDLLLTVAHENRTILATRRAIVR